MRAYVLSDKALAKHSGQFAWLSIDTENPKNQGFLEKFPISVWPTFLVIDPPSQKIALKWPGSATVKELTKLLEDGERAVRNSAGRGPEALLARADRLNGEHKTDEAVAAYREALKLGGAHWARRPRTVESLTFALQLSGELENCARTAMEEAPTLPRGPSFANVAATGLSCALTAPKQTAWREKAIQSLVPLSQEAVSLPGLLADDRSGIYDNLVSVEQDRNDPAAAKRIASDWLTFLEHEAAHAPNAEARAAFDPLRLAAALVLGEPERVLPALQASERDLPGDYNPPARLATVYRALGRYDDALAASDRALAKVYGPRRINVLQTRASIFEKKGDKASAERTLEEAIKFAESLPQTEATKKLVQRLRNQ